MSLPKDYEDLLIQSQQGSIYANRWWLDAVAPGAYEILEVGNSAGLKAAWPVVSFTEEGERHVCMPALSQKLGILFAPAAGKPAEILSTRQRLTEELLEKLGNRSSFHQNFHEEYTDWLPFYWSGYTQTTRYTYVLDNVSNQSLLWSGMRDNYRNKVRKAEKEGLEVDSDIDFQRFLDVHRKTFDRQSRSPLADDEFITRLDRACQANAGRRIFATIDADKRVHAVVYVAWWNGTAYYLLGGADPELRASGGHVLALWEAVKFSSTVAQRFDFEGSMLPQVEMVFRGFGAVQRPYFSISKAPPGPSSLGGYLRYAVDFRVKRLRRRLRR